MTGFIQGSLKNFEMEYGQPSRFILDIESVKTKGVKQEISVDAINNISILGTGSGSAVVLNAGIKRFFKEYPYSKMAYNALWKMITFLSGERFMKEEKNIWCDVPF